MRKSEQSSFQVAAVERAGRLALKIDAVAPDGSFRNDLSVTVNCVGPDGSTKTLRASQNGPGSYATEVPLPAQGTMIFSVSAGGEKDSSYVFGYTRSYPREFFNSETDETLLRQIAGIGHGKYAPTPAEVFARPPTASRHPLDLTPYFLGLALVLFPIDIWMRRRAGAG